MHEVKGGLCCFLAAALPRPRRSSEPAGESERAGGAAGGRPRCVPPRRLQCHHQRAGESHRGVCQPLPCRSLCTSGDFYKKTLSFFRSLPGIPSRGSFAPSVTSAWGIHRKPSRIWRRPRGSATTTAPPSWSSACCTTAWANTTSHSSELQTNCVEYVRVMQTRLIFVSRASVQTVVLPTLNSI